MAAKRDKKAGWRPFWGRERGEGKLFGKGLGWEAFWEGLRIEGMGGGRQLHVRRSLGSGSSHCLDCTSPFIFIFGRKKSTDY